MALPRMVPSPAEHLLRYVGDRLRVTLEPPQGVGPGCRAFVRTNLTRAHVARAEVVAKSGLRREEALTFAGASWRDIPLTATTDGWEIDLPLIEVGHFRAKAYCVDAEGRQHWPEGPDLGISVHPNSLRSANTVYCAFPRTFGNHERATAPELEAAMRALDERQYTVIPPSGTLRGLTRVLPHIFDVLGCRILHLLPVGPVPTTFARMGRYGSPYAQLDLTRIDPAFVELDKRTNAVDQFRELTDGVHLRDGLVLLDIVLNHTGWGSRLLDEHPEWFARNADGTFHSPGAWGVVWADLVELDQRHRELWDVLADSLITWCRRGVDGFRCDAGYMIPLPAWQYVVARVREHFPDCVFLLEGLGGPWDATRTLLTDGGMQWAYSELFQCYEPAHVAHYLDHANDASARLGVLIHYSETHDNDRLAAKGARWSSMRNALCALSSHAGAFGFSAGVEWLCAEKFRVHEARSLAWGATPNLVDELGRLNGLLDAHPCFFDGAAVTRVSPDDSPVVALERTSQEGRDTCLVLVNLDIEQPRRLALPRARVERLGAPPVDLLSQTPVAPHAIDGAQVAFELAPGQSMCLARSAQPEGLAGDLYRVRRAQAAFAYAALGAVLPHEALGPAEFGALAELVAADPTAFLAAIANLDLEETRRDLVTAMRCAQAKAGYPRVVTWTTEDASRVTLVPPEHWLLVRDPKPFAVDVTDAGRELHLRSVALDHDYVVAVPPSPGDEERDITVHLDRFEASGVTVATLRRLARRPRFVDRTTEGLVLLTNGRGAMSRLSADLGSVQSKYDCLLGANFHAAVPVDRHILAKRARLWVNADGFITALDGSNLVSLASGPPAVWTFAANAGDGRQVGIRLCVELVHDRNAVVMRVERVPTTTKELPKERSVRVTVRLDLEDRCFHHETRATSELEVHFARSTWTLGDRAGFGFAPAHDRTLRAWTDRGSYHASIEWSRDVPHPLEATRGMSNRGDAFSPGWFDLPLDREEPVTLVLSAQPDELSGDELARVARAPDATVREERDSLLPGLASFEGDDSFEAQLRRAVDAFVVRRGQGSTIIAGYPWFLDWGRDTLICVRGLVAAGRIAEAQDIVRTYAGFERRGTLPNCLSGESTANRETSDAPLWLGLACEELAAHVGPALYALSVDGQRTLADVLASIADHHLEGTDVGVYVDHASGLVWSPSHYTWMDTNHPAGTPREGYPIELSVLFARLLRQLAQLDGGARAVTYTPWAERTERSLSLYYREDRGYFSDTLHAHRGIEARYAAADDHLRPNHLLALSLGLVSGEPARRTLDAVTRKLLVPGALRTLAPGLVHPPIRIRRGDVLLNDPDRPYWGRYEGDEDTRRKPAYHNGTAWVWWLPAYCEALVRTYAGDRTAIDAARAVLGSTGRLLAEGCLGQLPEILDGDAPHTQRGCDAQAWSITETLRVWLALR